MGLLAKPRGAAWPRGAWGHSRRRAASGGRDGAAPASFAAGYWKIGLGAWREMTERGVRARAAAAGAKTQKGPRTGSRTAPFSRARRATRIKNLPLRLGRCLGDDLLPSPTIDDGLREALVVPFLGLVPPLLPLIISGL